MSDMYYPKPEILGKIPLDRHAVIEASAGTGKTYTIEHLFVEILLAQNASVDEILVVTYTEKAAAELRARVRRIIEKLLESDTTVQPKGAHWYITQDNKNRLERALFSFDKAPIHTIHGFFQRVIVENAFKGGRLFDQELTETKRLFSEEFTRALRTRIARDTVLRAHLAQLLEQGGEGVEGLQKLLLNVYGKKSRIQPVYDPAGYAREAESAAVAFHAELEPGRIEAACKAKKLHASTKKAVLDAIERVNRALEERRRRGSVPLQGIGEDLVSIQEKLAPKVFEENSPAILAAGTLRTLDLDSKAAAVNLFLPLVKKLLNERKLRDGLYDFDDMIAYLQEALNGAQSKSLISSLRSRYRYALIDESQDTDAGQWEIFRKIFYDSTGDNRIYLIGDPKQAIYGFRGADVFTYLNARNDICGKDSPVRLEENFRSTEKLIRAYNLLLDQKAAPPFFDGAITYEFPVQSGQKDLEALYQDGKSVVPICMMQAMPDKDGNLKSWMVKEQMGRFIASEIKALLGEKKIYLCMKGGTKQEISARDIFILTRSIKDGIKVAEHLRQAQVPFAFYKQDGLFQTREAGEVRDLLAAIADPANVPKRLKAWISGFFGISLEEVSACRDLPDTDPLVRKLLEWHGHARQRNYRHLFTGIIDETGIVRRELFLQDNERRLTNYYHIFEILLEETMHASLDMEGVVQLLNGFIAETGRPTGENGNVQRLETEKEAVQIMTLHKSKGLEAPVVFLYGGFTQGPGDGLHTFHEGSERVVYVGTPPADTMALADQESREESQRLLYVGMTRAKARLYLPFIDTPPEGKSYPKLEEGPYNELNTRLRAFRKDPANVPDLFEWRQAPCTLPGDTEQTAAVEKLPEWAPDASLLSVPDDGKEFAGIRQAHAGFVITSYTRIKQLEHAGRDEGAEDRDTEQSERVAAEWAGPVQIAGPAFGSAMHEIMEKVPFDSFGNGVSLEEWAAILRIREICEDALAKTGIDPWHLPFSQAMAYNTLTAPVTLGTDITIPGLYALKDHSRETEFLYPYPEEFHPRLDQDTTGWRIERGYVKGFIDFMFRYEGKAYFLDWKTDLMPDYSQAEMQKHVDSRYDLQVRLYLLAMMKLMGCRSREAYEKEFGGILYCFMRGMGRGQEGAGMYALRPDWDEVLGYEQELIKSRGNI